MLLDKDIRDSLFDFLEESYGQVRIIEEKMMGKSRADAVMVTRKSLFGIEIKSDADTYARLSRQVNDYDKFYDYNIVVVGSSHARHIGEHVPKYWGIITVEEIDGIPDYYILRKPEINPKVKWKNKIKILWRPELAKLQEWNKMPKYTARSKEFVQKKIIERIPDKIPEELIREQISYLLFERDYNTISEMIDSYKKGK